jgi:hypothetical protein
MVLLVLRLYSISDGIFNEYGTVGGMRICRGNQSTIRKTTPVPVCPPQIPHAELGLNLGCCGGNTATKCLSYGMTQTLNFS